MPFPVRAVRVLVASPGDLPVERDHVEEVLHRWNERRSEESGIVLLPLRWETGSVAVIGEGDAQSVINAQLVDKADIVIALFHAKLGSPTDRAVSGTAEEIERSVEAGKRVHVYFSTRALPNPVDTAQYEALAKFRQRIQKLGLIGSFKNKVSLTKVVQDAIEYDLVRLSPVAGSGNGHLVGRSHLVDTFVDSALFLHDDHNGRKEISERLQPIAALIDEGASGPPLIPTRYHFSTEAAAELWLSRSRDAGPRSHQRKSKEFWRGQGGTRIADFVRDHISPDKALDFISLGPGDGTKDAHMALRWIEGGVDLTYYPYDASTRLASVAVNQVASHTKGSKHAHLLNRVLVLADFRDLNRVREIFRLRPARNIVSLLGNQLGNLDDDVGFLQDLTLIMTAKDLLLLEVRLRSSATVDDLTPEASLRHDFCPLEYYMGMDWITYKSGVATDFLETKSEVEGTTTLVTTYTGNVPEFVGEQVATLQYIHFYEHERFIAKVEEIGFEVLYEEVGAGGTFLTLLLRQAVSREASID